MREICARLNRKEIRRIEDKRRTRRQRGIGESLALRILAAFRAFQVCRRIVDYHQSAAALDRKKLFWSKQRMLPYKIRSELQEGQTDRIIFLLRAKIGVPPEQLKAETLLLPLDWKG